MEKAGVSCVVWAIVYAGLICGIVSCGASKAVQPPESAGSETVTPDKSEPDELPPRHVVTDRVEIRTSKGSIIVGLYGKDAPHTIASFLTYVDRDFYAGKIFHRIIPGFMIQGGGFDAELNRVPTDAPIQLEIIPGLRHEPGIVSMARTSDPHSATSQFFICVGNASQLNGGYAVFGKVEEGLEVVQKISAVETKTVELENGPMTDVPSTPVIIESITRK